MSFQKIKTSNYEYVNLYIRIDSTENSKDPEFELRKLFCTLALIMKDTSNIYGIEVSSELGITNFYLGQEDKYYFENPCDYKLNNQSLCDTFEADTNICKQCKLGFDLDQDSKL